jgi:fatty acid desaturase
MPTWEPDRREWIAIALGLAVAVALAWFLFGLLGWLGVGLVGLTGLMFPAASPWTTAERCRILTLGRRASALWPDRWRKSIAFRPSNGRPAGPSRRNAVQSSIS